MQPTTDVTDVGNKPGDGPLRAGGVATAEASGEDLPSTYSEVAEAQLPAVERARDLWAGNDVVKGKGQEYLPRDPGEDVKAYAARLARSVYINFFRTAIDGMAGLIYRTDPVLGEDVPETIREHWENIDNEGTHGDVFCRDITTDAMIAGHAAILVEYPNTGGGQYRDEEMTLGIRPYWVPIKKENIVSWRTTVEFGIRTLAQLVLREQTWVPAGQFGQKKQEQYRVFYRNEMGKVGFLLLEVTSSKNIVLVDEGTYPTQPNIPVVEVATSGTKGLFESDPPFNGLGALAIAFYQMWSDHANSIHKTCVPFIFGAGIPEAKNADGTPAGPLVVGPNTAILSQDAQAKMMYISHDGSALGSSKAALDDLRSDMGTLGQSMLAPQKRAAETARAQQLNKASQDAPLAVIARASQDAFENALQIHANYLRLPTGGSITINRDFEGLAMEPSVMGAFAQLVNVGMPVEPVVAALREGRRIAEDIDIEALAMEWMMGRELDKNMPGEVEKPEV